MIERFAFLICFFRSVQMQCGLDIVTVVPHIADKINLGLHTLSLFPYLDNPDIYIIPTHQQFIVNRIFHKMRFFLLPEIQTRITKSDVRKIIFMRSIDVLPSFHIITECLFDNECIFEIRKISVNC